MAARAMVRHPEQGWSLLCNDIVLFDDAGALLPGGQEVAAPAPVVLPVGAAVAAACPGEN